MIGATKLLLGGLIALGSTLGFGQEVDSEIEAPVEAPADMSEAEVLPDEAVAPEESAEPPSVEAKSPKATGTTPEPASTAPAESATENMALPGQESAPAAPNEAGNNAIPGAEETSSSGPGEIPVASGSLTPTSAHGEGGMNPLVYVFGGIGGLVALFALFTFYKRKKTWDEISDAMKIDGGDTPMGSQPPSQFNTQDIAGISTTQVSRPISEIKD